MSILFSATTTNDIPAGSTIQVLSPVVLPPPPTAAFGGSVLTGTFPLSVQFTDQSTNLPTSWTWDFGDGGKSNLQSPIHIYTAAGTYTVSLSVANAYGNNSITKTAYITVSAPVQVLTGTLPECIVWVDLNEVSDGTASVKRMDSRFVTSTMVNPPRIANFLDPNKTKSVPGLGGHNAAYFDTVGAFGAWNYLVTEQSNQSGGILNDIFVGALGSISMFGRVMYNTLPGGESVLCAREYSYQLYADNSHKFKFMSYGQDGVISIVTSPINIVAGRWYSIAGGYDAAAGLIFIVVIDDTGTLTRTTLAVNQRVANDFSSGFYIGGRSGGAGQLHGSAMEVRAFKAAITDAECQVLHNNGVPLPYSSSLLAPTRDSGPAPFTNVQLVNPLFLSTVTNPPSPTDIPRHGLYWFHCRNLRTWNPALADIHGDYIWCVTDDHPIVAGAAAGVYIGYSSSPSIRPATWTLIIPGNGIARGPDYPGVTDRNYIALEAAMLCYDPIEQKVRCYVHCETASGGPTGSGLSGPTQETLLWDSPDLTTWTAHGVAIPAFPNSANFSVSAVDHTGYAVVYAPGELPGQTNWVAYHLAVSAWAISRANVSVDGKVWNAAGNIIPLDVSGPFPAGYDQTQWLENLIVVGQKVYGIGLSNVPNGRGMVMCEIGQDAAGVWRIPTGKIWPIGDVDAGGFPGTGRTQDIRIFHDPLTNIVHIYRLMGFYPQSTDNPKELIRYYTLSMAT